jgi:hypothetical protein
MPLSLEQFAVPATDQVVLNPKLRFLATSQQDRQANGECPLLCRRGHDMKANDHDGGGGEMALRGRVARKHPERTGFSPS